MIENLGVKFVLLLNFNLDVCYWDFSVLCLLIFVLFLGSDLIVVLLKYVVDMGMLEKFVFIFFG